MCQLIETITTREDGSRHTATETITCPKAHHGKLCSNVKTRTTEYYPGTKSASSRGESPTSNGPFTPPTSGAPYKTEIHRPSSSSSRGTRRPSIIKPEIIIELGGKGKGPKSYPRRHYPRSSLGGTSTHSNEGVLDSPGSDKILTGFPEATLPTPTFSAPPSDSYNYRTVAPQGYRTTPSTSSHSTSQVPSLTSEPESPTGRRSGARYPPALVHNPPIPVAPSSPSSSRAQYSSTSSSSRVNYRTETVAPKLPLDYDDFLPSRPPVSSHASSGRDEAPEITARSIYREEQRRADKRRQQEEDDRRIAEQYAKELEKEEKTVRFVDDRDQGRDEQRRKHKEDRQRKEEKQSSRKDGEKRATKKPERPKTKPPAGFDNYSGRGRRRSSISSMTPEERDKLAQLRQVDIVVQEREREAADRRDREEQQMLVQAQYAPAPTAPPTLRQQQDTIEYYNPRARSGSQMGRRDSLSRRGSVSYTTPVISQPAPPPPQTAYQTRQPTSHYTSSSSTGSYTTSSTIRPLSARHSSYHHDNPFAAPSTRPIHPSSSDPPFSPTPSVLPPSSAADPWDSRPLRANLPSSPSGAYPRHNALQMMGEQVINRSGDRNAHRRAQAATQNMGRALESSSSDDDDDEDDQVEHARTARYGAKLGMGKGKRRS